MYPQTWARRCTNFCQAYWYRENWIGPRNGLNPVPLQGQKSLQPIRSQTDSRLSSSKIGLLSHQNLSNRKSKREDKPSSDPTRSSQLRSHRTFHFQLSPSLDAL